MYTPLFLAIEADVGIDAITLLVEAGADVDNKDAAQLYYEEYLWYTEYDCEERHEMAERETSNYGLSTLLMATWNGRQDIVKLLIDHGADTEIKNIFRRTPLSVASERGHMGIVQILLKSEAKIHDDSGYTMYSDKHHFSFCIEEHEGEKYSPALMYAAENGHNEIVKLLLQSGANPNSKFKYNQYPLLIACKNGHAEIVRMLIDAGARMNECIYILRGAAICDSLEIAKLLVERGVSDEGKYEALLGASSYGRIEMVKFLLENGAKPLGYNRQHPLRLAASNGNVEIVKILIDAGYDIDARDPKACDYNCYSPIMLASGAMSSKDQFDDRRVETIKTLLKAGAKVDQNTLCRIPLKNNLKVVKMLVDAGASVNSENRYSEKVLHHACKCGDVDIVKYLVEKGSRAEFLYNYQIPKDPKIREILRKAFSLGV